VPTSERQRVLDWVGEELGTVRMWRVTILSGIGLVLVLGLVGILGGVYVSGSATLDDLGLPLVFTLVLTPILAGGLIYGALGIRALRTHELLLALQKRPPAIARYEEAVNGGWRGVRFHMPSGQQYTLWAASPDWAAHVIRTLSS